MALSKTELVELVKKVADSQGTDDEVAEWMEIVMNETGCPNIGEYIFYTDPEMTPDEVVEKARSYKPIQL